MVLFLVIASLYATALLLIRPSPESLKAKAIPFRQHLGTIKVSLFSGLFIATIFLFTSKLTFASSDDKILLLLALNNLHDAPHLWGMQYLTHLFVHINLLHLLANLFGLGLASVYERRVGSKRFISVLTVGSLASIPSIYLYSDTILVTGISGGIFGVAAAYFTDNRTLTVKEWLWAIVMFSMLFFILSLESVIKSDAASMAFQTDHIGHIMGAVGAIIYCRITRKKSETPSELISQKIGNSK